MTEKRTGDIGDAALGLDGGAGRLKFVVRTPDGRNVFYECGGANPNLMPMNEYVARLGQGINDALSTAGCSAEQIRTAGFGLSGVDREGEIEVLRRKLQMILPGAEKIWIGNDALPALRQGAGILRGLILIAGTGSICFAVSSPVRVRRVGGWGGDLGDEGSGFWIGLRGLQACCRMADGRIPRTPLMQAVLDRLGVEDPGDLIPWSSSRSRVEFKNEVAALFPVIADHAATGDHSAKQALLLGVGHLIQHVLTTEMQLKMLDNTTVMGQDTQTGDEEGEDTHATDPTGETQVEDSVPSHRINLVCSGGLFTGNKMFYDMFVLQLKRKRDVFNPILLTESAALGAMALGQEVEEPAASAR